MKETKNSVFWMNLWHITAKRCLKCNLRKMKNFLKTMTKKRKTEKHNLKTKLASRATRKTSRRQSCNSCLPFCVYHRFDVAFEAFYLYSIEKIISRLVRCVKSSFRGEDQGKLKLQEILISQPRVYVFTRVFWGAILKSFLHENLKNLLRISKETFHVFFFVALTNSNFMRWKFLSLAPVIKSS